MFYPDDLMNLTDADRLDLEHFETYCDGLLKELSESLPKDFSGFQLIYTATKNPDTDQLTFTSKSARLLAAKYRAAGYQAEVKPDPAGYLLVIIL